MHEIREKLSSSALKNVMHWLTEPKYIEYRPELLLLIAGKEWQILEDAFFKSIEFGTAGMRGSTGIGSNRINRITIGQAAQALCLYAQSVDPNAHKRGVVIACDTRLTSPELSEYAASVCVANGFRTFLFESFRSTPELSFAVRDLRASVGIVISASHNQPADNGFKAYWSDGGQLVSPHAEGIMREYEQIDTILITNFQNEVESGKITLVGKSIDTAYVSAVVNTAEGVYSPLHGAGQTNVLPVLRQAGFKSISLVEEQMVPDGNFPSVENHKPNPEEKAANAKAVLQMLAEKADIAITNDPDADRIGVMVRQDERAIYLSGNQAAALAANYTLERLKKRDELSSKHFMAKTIVTTDMLQALADSFNVNLYTDMLIGFKYIGKLLGEKENTDEIFVIGAEESYGLLKGDYARDKDGASGALVLAEYAADLRRDGKTLYDKLLELYRVHGLYIETLDSMYFEGASGFKKMQSVMSKLRKTPLLDINGHQVSAIRDYQYLERRDTATQVASSLSCERGDVIVLELNGDYRCRITIRPSGTEPKLKFYIQWYELAEANIVNQIERVTDELSSISRNLERHFLE
jgi:phosphoglucomutase